MAGEQFSLVWNSFPRNLSSGLYTLLADEQLVDVTLAAEGQILRAHKLILSVCSTYFRDLFKGNSCKHPIVILKDVNYRDLSAMLHFMYQGEVNIKKEDIAGFLKVAETLQIKGLTTDTEEKLEETLTKSGQNLDQLFNTEKNSINSFTPDANASTFTEQSQFLQKDQQCKRQDVSSRDEYLNNENPDSYYQQDSISDPTCNMQDIDTIQNENSANVEEQCNEEEPLNCTSDINYTIPQKQEPLNYTLDTDLKTRYKTYLPNKSVYRPEENSQIKDYAPEMQLVPYDQNAQIQPYGVSNNSLPLETTLRVVSELGPTLRMERGKVIRMYSCPWCLRHFTRKENLKLHVRYIHGPLESLTCKLCGNKYKNSNSLRVHSYLYHNAKRNKPNKPFVDGGA